MKKLYAAAVAVLMLWAVVGWGQTVTSTGQSTNGINQPQMVGGRQEGGNISQDQQYDTDGNLLVSNRQGIPTLMNAVITTNLTAGTADSSIVLDVHKFTYLKFLIKAIPRGGANTTVRLAIQFRECMNGNVDSTSSFAEFMYGKVDNGTTTANVVDTTMAGHLVTGSVSLPWSGEYVMRFDGARSAPGNGVAANVFSYPNGVSIPFDAIFGRQVRFNQLQIRIRNLNANSPGVDISSYVLGFTR